MFKKYIFSILFNTNEKTKISISIRRIKQIQTTYSFEIFIWITLYIEKQTYPCLEGRWKTVRCRISGTGADRGTAFCDLFATARVRVLGGDEYWKEGCAETVRKAPYCWICAHGDRLKYLCRRFLAACKLRAVPPIVSIRTPELRRRRIIPAPLCRIFVSSASTYGASIREFVTTSEATCIADEALFRSPFMLMQMHAILFGSSTSFERRIRSIKTCQMLLL